MGAVQEPQELQITFSRPLHFSTAGHGEKSGSTQRLFSINEGRNILLPNCLYQQTRLPSKLKNNMQTQPRIAVVGAGIIGVSTALRILQTLPHADVTIFTEHASPDTTSDVAGGFWEPSYLTNTPHDIVNEWGKDTFDYLIQMARFDPKSGSYGVFLSPGYELFTKSSEPVTMYWSHITIGYRQATPQELAMFPNKNIKSGIFYMTVVAEGAKFLPHLTAQFKSLGGKLIEGQKLESFSQLHRLGYRHIVNCTGLGAMKLCQDASMFPIRGQVHRVRAPWLKFWYILDDGTYCLLNTEHAVLGGVSQIGNWSTEVSQQDKRDILDRHCALWPPMRGAPVLADLVGLRPGRDRVRVEREVVRRGEEKKAEPLTGVGGNSTLFTIYHNYGHGGSGLTIFWGCAGQVVGMLLEDLAADTEAAAAKL